MPNEEKQIHITFPDRSTVSKVVNFLVKKRPPNWSRRSFATYYTEDYAEWLRKDIDSMIQDRTPIIYRYDKWPRVSPNSLYLRINQALMYILDSEEGGAYPDSNNKYKKFREQVKIKRIPNVGISLKFDEILQPEVQAERFIGNEDAPKWKQKMDAWIENPDALEPFCQEGLLLTPMEIKQLETELEGSGLMFTIDSRSIKIIKG